MDEGSSKAAVGRKKGKDGRWVNQFPLMSAEEKYRRWYEDNKDEIRCKARIRRAAYRLAHPDKVRISDKKHYDTVGKLKRANDVERQRKISSAYMRRRRAKDPLFRLKCILRSRISIAIRMGNGRKSVRTMELLGCSIDSLMEHLEKKWVPGMGWHNWSRNGWHIDHIRPCASFDLSDPEQQKQCFHFSNLQPLWAEDNRKKSDTY